MKLKFLLVPIFTIACQSQLSTRRDEVRFSSKCLMKVDIMDGDNCQFRRIVFSPDCNADLINVKLDSIEMLHDIRRCDEHR